MKRIPTGLIVSITLTSALFFCYFFIDQIPLGECAIYRYTGFYCPACGCTRAVKSFFNGRLLDSLRFNPLFLYLGVSFWLYAIIELFSVRMGRLQNILPVIQKIFIFLGVIIMIYHLVLNNI